MYILLIAAMRDILIYWPVIYIDKWVVLQVTEHSRQLVTCGLSYQIFSKTLRFLIYEIVVR